MRLGAVFQNALAAGPGAYSQGVTTRLNEDSLRRNAEAEQASLENMRRAERANAEIAAGAGPIKANFTPQVTTALPVLQVAPVAPTATTAAAPVGLRMPTATAPTATAPTAGGFSAAQHDTASMIRDAATKFGLNPDVAVKIAMFESRLKGNAQNPNSSAGGLFQFTDDTWNAMGGGNKADVGLNIQRGVQLMKDYHASLTRGLKRMPTEAEMYLAHQQGPNGALSLLLNPNALAIGVLKAAGVNAAQAEASILQNGGTKDMTAGQFAAMINRKFSGTSIPQAGPAKPSTEQAAWDAKYGAKYNPDGSLKAAAGPAATTASTVGGIGVGGAGGILNVGEKIISLASAGLTGMASQPGVMGFVQGIANVATRAGKDMGGKAQDKAPPRPGAPKPVKAAGVQVAATKPTAEASLADAVVAQQVGKSDVTKWAPVLLDTPNKPSQELSALTDQRSELVRIAEIYRKNGLTGQFMQVRDKVAELDKTSMYLHGMQAIQNFKLGDPRYLQAVLSEMHGPVEIQPRSDGNFDLFVVANGKRQPWGTNVSQDEVVSMSRYEIDASYRAMLAEMATEQAKTNETIRVEVAKSGLKRAEIGVQAEADIMKAVAQGGINRLNETVKAQMGANWSSQVMADGSVFMTNKLTGQYAQISPKEATGPGGVKVQTLASLTGQAPATNGTSGNNFAWQ